MTDLDPLAWAERLELFRRSVDLRLDLEGHWWHEGARFEHPRLIALFDQGLDVHPDTGEAILRIGDKWCYVRADGGTPFIVRRLEVVDGGLEAALNTGARWAVPATAFAADDTHVYIEIDSTRRARLDRRTQARLADWLVELEGTLAVEVDGQRWPVRQRVG